LIVGSLSSLARIQHLLKFKTQLRVHTCWR